MYTDGKKGKRETTARLCELVSIKELFRLLPVLLINLVRKMSLLLFLKYKLKRFLTIQAIITCVMYSI